MLLANWFHSLATVVFIGYFVVQALVDVPALAANNDGQALSEISKRSRPWLYASMFTVAVTGIYLMLVDPKYLGIGSFSNSWSIAMLLKHILVVIMIAIGFWFNAIMRVGPAMFSGGQPAIGRYARYVNAMAVCGAIVLLLTTFARSV